MKYLFAIRDTNDGAIHSSNVTSCLDDAMSAAEELAYQHEIDINDLEVVELVERLNSSRRVSA